ncbi:suppressor protein srp40 protein [Apiospora arundinis]
MAIGTSKPPSKSAPFVADKDGYTRLHIAPLDPELIGIVLSSSVRPLARNISYHSIETFPERRYGFVEVPTAEAEKLRKKLNGATLKGSKMRVEQAKPESIPPPTGVVAEEDVKVKKSHKKEKKEKKKRKRGEPEVLDGVVLSDRKIKRGWTVSEGEMIKEKRKDKDRNKSVKEKKEKKDKKEKRSAEKSKYTDAPECLFKQKMPEIPSAKPAAAEDEEEDAPRRKKKRSNRETVVHEFERSTKYPSFLRAVVDDTKKAESLEFEDGKGWVDATGNVVEPLKVTKVPELPKPKKGVPEWPMPKKYEPKPAPEEDDDTSSSGSSDSEAEEPTKPQKVVKKKAAKSEKEDDTSSSDSSSESSSESEEEEASPSKVRTPAKNLRVDTQGAASSPSSGLKLDSSRPKSSGSMTSLTIKIPPPTTPASGKAVHPLEALYKRTEGANETGATTDAQPFSFFNNDDDDIEEEAAPAQIPMTPYSKQDFEFRATRSAAPTPDTAHPSRSYLPWSTQEDDLAEEDEEIEADGEDMEDADGDMAMAGAAADGDQSKASAATDFQKFFWENRGDLNRKWKKRRKTALKERRNRENRARAARAI